MNKKKNHSHTLPLKQKRFQHSMHGLSVCLHAAVQFDEQFRVQSFPYVPAWHAKINSVHSDKTTK